MQTVFTLDFMVDKQVCDIETHIYTRTKVFSSCKSTVANLANHLHSLLMSQHPRDMTDLQIQNSMKEKQKQKHQLIKI